jgi:hypothetical protein
VPVYPGGRAPRAARRAPFVELEAGGRTVRVANPDKVFFAERGETKLDLVRYDPPSPTEASPAAASRVIHTPPALRAMARGQTPGRDSAGHGPLLFARDARD